MKASSLSSISADFPTGEVEYLDMLTWRYAYGGRVATGIDCLGIVLEVFARAGVGLQDPKDIGVLEFGDYWEAIDDPSELYDLAQIEYNDPSGAVVSSHSGDLAGSHLEIVVRYGLLLSAGEGKNVYARRVKVLQRRAGIKFWRLKAEARP